MFITPATTLTPRQGWQESVEHCWSTHFQSFATRATPLLQRLQRRSILRLKTSRRAPQWEVVWRWSLYKIIISTIFCKHVFVVFDVICLTGADFNNMTIICDDNQSTRGTVTAREICTGWDPIPTFGSTIVGNFAHIYIYGYSIYISYTILDTLPSYIIPRRHPWRYTIYQPAYHSDIAAYISDIYIYIVCYTIEIYINIAAVH